MKIEIQRAKNPLNEKSSPNKCVVQNLGKPSSKVTELSITVNGDLVENSVRHEKKHPTHPT